MSLLIHRVIYSFTSGQVIRKITPTGTTTTLAGSTYGFADNDVGTSAKFWGPHGIAVDLSNNVYVADYNNNRIRKIAPSGSTTTLAGNGNMGHTDSSSGASVQFTLPQGVAVDSSGTVYVADTGNNCIRKVSPTGSTTTLAGNGNMGYADSSVGTSASFYSPTAIALDSYGNLYVADTNNKRVR